MANTYVLDPTVAALVVVVLDGELWEREPYLLVSHHEDLLLQLENMSLLELKLKSPMLKQSLAAFSFAKKRHTSGTGPLSMTPTAGLALSRYQKVRITHKGVVHATTAMPITCSYLQYIVCKDLEYCM